MDGDTGSGAFALPLELDTYVQKSIAHLLEPCACRQHLDSKLSEAEDHRRQLQLQVHELYSRLEEADCKCAKAKVQWSLLHYRKWRLGSLLRDNSIMSFKAFSGTRFVHFWLSMKHYSCWMAARGMLECPSFEAADRRLAETGGSLQGGDARMRITDSGVCTTGKWV